MLPLGVANSIFAASGFDASATIRFAAERALECVQIYVSQPRALDEAQRLGRACADAGLWPICHWPDRLGLAQARDAALFSWTTEFFDSSPRAQRAVVLHFDGTLPTDVTCESIALVAEAGLLPYLENTFHGPDPDESERCLDRLIAALEGSARRGSPCGVVIDAPRFFCLHNGPVGRAMNRLERLTSAAAQADLPAILHIVDVTDYEQARGTWAVMGQGILPWAEIAAVIAASGLDVVAAVLEHEDPEQAEASLTTCRAWLETVRLTKDPLLS